MFPLLYGVVRSARRRRVEGRVEEGAGDEWRRGVVSFAVGGSTWVRLCDDGSGCTAEPDAVYGGTAATGVLQEKLTSTRILLV